MARSSSSISVPIELRELRQSDLGTMLSCGRKLWLSKVERHPRPTTAKQISGTAFHRGLEAMYAAAMVGDLVDLGDAKRWASESLQVGFSLAGEAISSEEDDDAEEAAGRAAMRVNMGLEHYHEHVLPGILSRGTPLAIETRLEVEYRGFQLNGTVDLIDGGSALRDHKFTQAYLPKEMPESYLAQLARYLWFLDRAGVPVVDACLDMVSCARAFLRKEARIETKHFDLASVGLTVADAIRIGAESVDSALNLIEAGVYARNGMNTFGGGCGICPHKGPICSGLAAMTPSGVAA